MFSNLRGCDGQRVYFNGCSCIAMNGEILKRTQQFALQEVVSLCCHVYSIISKNNVFKLLASCSTAVIRFSASVTFWRSYYRKKSDIKMYIKIIVKKYQFNSFKSTFFCKHQMVFQRTCTISWMGWMCMNNSKYIFYYKYCMMNVSMYLETNNCEIVVLFMKMFNIWRYRSVSCEHTIVSGNKQL